MVFSKYKAQNYIVNKRMIPSTSISKIYVLGSAQREPDRIKYLHAYFTHERILDIQYRQKTWGTTLSDTDTSLFSKQVHTDAGARDFRPSEMSIFLNYIDVLVEFVKCGSGGGSDNDTYCMILESDVIFDDTLNFRSYFQALDVFIKNVHPEIVSFGSGCDMVSGEVNTNDMNFQIFPEPTRVRCMDSFLFSYKGAVNFLNYCKNQLAAGKLYNLPIDNYLEEYLKTRADETPSVQWWVWPSLTFQGSQNGYYKSTIQINEV